MAFGGQVEHDFLRVTDGTAQLESATPGNRRESRTSNLSWLKASTPLMLLKPFGRSM